MQHMYTESSCFVTKLNLFPFCLVYKYFLPVIPSGDRTQARRKTGRGKMRKGKNAENYHLKKENKRPG